MRRGLGKSIPCLYLASLIVFLVVYMDILRTFTYISPFVSILLCLFFYILRLTRRAVHVLHGKQVRTLCMGSLCL